MRTFNTLAHWANVDPDQCRHMVSMGQNELKWENTETHDCPQNAQIYKKKPKKQKKLECAASNGNRYPPYPQVMATAISQ